MDVEIAKLPITAGKRPPAPTVVLPKPRSTISIAPAPPGEITAQLRVGSTATEGFAPVLYDVKFPPTVISGQGATEQFAGEFVLGLMRSIIVPRFVLVFATKARWVWGL